MVVWIRQFQPFDQVLIAAHETITDVGTHQLPRPLQLLAFQIGAIFKHVSDPLVVNFIGPTSTEEIGQRQPHQQIAKRRGIQNTRIIECCER